MTAKVCIMFRQSPELFWKTTHLENRLLLCTLQSKWRFVRQCIHRSDETFTFKHVVFTVYGVHNLRNLGLNCFCKISREFILITFV